MLFVIARNRSGRPTLQHVLLPGDPTHTQCGLEIWEWSRAYQNEMITEIICKRCKNRV